VIVAKAIGANGVAPGSQLLQAAQWMTDPDGNPSTSDHPRVINNSWAATDPNDVWFRSMVRVWRGLGIVPVFAAGNSGPGAGTIGSPASYPETLAVGALDSPTEVASYSSRGPIVWQNRDEEGPAAGTQIVKPDLAAPGSDILSSYGNGYEAFSGTSMASPHVAGAIALLMQAAPGATPDAITQVLTATAADVAPAGFDARSGAGLIDVMGAAAAITGLPAGQIDARLTRRPASPTRAPILAYRVALSNAPAYQVRVDRGAWGPLRYGTTFQLRLGQGRHTVRVRAVSVNGDGRVDMAPARHTVVVDRERPNTKLRWRPVDRRVVFRANAVDRLSGVRRIVWRLGDGRTATGRIVRHRYRDSRPRRVRLAVTDRAGNVRRSAHTVTPRTPTIARLTVSPRVSAGAARLPIALRLIQAGRLRVSLARISAQPLLAQKGREALTTGRIIRRGRPGTVRASLGVRRLAAGTYRLRAEVLGPAGRGEPPVERIVRIVA
jgi:Subtilase family/PKD domain